MFMQTSENREKILGSLHEMISSRENSMLIT